MQRGLGFAAFVLAVFALPAFAQQEPDTSYDTRVARPAFTTRHPRVAIDEAHHNFHRIDGRYLVFANLLRHDGCDVVPGRSAFSAESLKGLDVLVISNALGHEDMASDSASNPAFTPEECSALHAWVEGGGALLLIADHAPMGAAARGLGEAFGVDMRCGYTTDPVQGIGDGGTLIAYDARHGLAADHAIVRGRDSTERVRRVVAFTGQSLAGPPGATVLLRLSDKAEDLMVGLGEAHGDVPKGKRKPAGGRAQGLAMTVGKGRAVVLGEAAMMSAQIARGSFKMGMNAPGSDDRQFAINVVRWLARALD
jgi:hypothetical protein